MAVAVGLATARPADAGMINGSLNFVPFGTVSVKNGGKGLGAITELSIPALEVVNGPDARGDYSIVPIGSKVTVNPLKFPIKNVNGDPFAVGGPTVTFGPFNTKTADPFDALPRFKFTPVTAQVTATAPDKNGASSLSYSSTGFVVDKDGLFAKTPTTFSFSATQSTLKGPVNVSFTLVSAAPVPLPAGLALGLTGLPGLALVRRFGRRLAA